jgi:hypothetical protein
MKHFTTLRRARCDLSILCLLLLAALAPIACSTYGGRQTPRGALTQPAQPGGTTAAGGTASTASTTPPAKPAPATPPQAAPTPAPAPPPKAMELDAG